MAANPEKPDFLTPEERQALKELPRRMRRKTRRTNFLERHQSEENFLRPWEQLFAYWLAFAPFKVTPVQKVQKATEFAHDTVTYGHVRYLLGRRDVKELMVKFQAGGIEAALEKLKSDLPFYVETHRKGLEMALEDGNYSVIPKYTLHALEIVAPRRNDLGQQNVQVNVTLSTKQQALLDSERPLIEAEVVRPDPTTE